VPAPAPGRGTKPGHAAPREPKRLNLPKTVPIYATEPPIAICINITHLTCFLMVESSSNISLRSYQRIAVSQYFDALTSLIKANENIDSPTGPPHLVLKAPTGSGKTVMMAEIIKKLIDNFEQHGKNIAFIWIAPNKLHKQSLQRLDSYFSDGSAECIDYTENSSILTDNELKHKQIIFTNWSSIDKGDKGLLTRLTERGDDLFSIVSNSKNNKCTIGLIIDEIHQSASAPAASQAQKNIKPNFIMGMSATPRPGVHTYSINRIDVVKAELVKKDVLINLNIDNIILDDSEIIGFEKFNLDLITFALKKRDELEQTYQDMGSHVNPLMLIQVPNDTHNESSNIKDIENFLKTKHGMKDTDYVVWTSDRHPPPDLTDNYNPIKVMIFKQAAAVGWDCKRADLLIILRGVKDHDNVTQTIGRLYRMPELKHYKNSILNSAYVYTPQSNIDLIKRVIQDEYKIDASVRTKHANNIKLDSIFLRQIALDPLDESFTETLNNKFKISPIATTLNTSFNFKTQSFNNDDDYVLPRLVPKNIRRDTLDDKQILVPEDSPTLRLKPNERDYQTAFDKFISTFESRCQPESMGQLKSSIYEIFANRDLSLRTTVQRFVLKHESDFKKLILIALDAFYSSQSRTRYSEEYTWSIPAREHYSITEKNKSQHAQLINTMTKLSMQPVPAWSPALNNLEINFLLYLQSNTGVTLIHRNGIHGREHFAIKYNAPDGSLAAFYPDFIIQLSNGQIGIFDTKSEERSSDTQKNIALQNYCKAYDLIGGIVTQSNADTNNWLYYTGTNSIDFAHATENNYDWGLLDNLLSISLR